MNITKQTPWSKIIEIQRLRWLGHCFRLPEDSPAIQALREAERKVARPRGRPITTWLDIIKKQLQEIGISWEEAKIIALDRKRWRNIVNGYLSNT